MPEPVTKVDNHTIATEKVQPEVKTPVTYDYGFLKTQRMSIQEHKDRDNVIRDRELAEIDALIAAADALGVTDRADAGGDVGAVLNP